MHNSSRHVLRLLAVVLATVLGAGFVSAAPAQAADTATISGRVTDKDGKPVAGASVFATRGDGSAQGGKTNAKGDYAIPSVPAGTYKVEAFPVDSSYDAQLYRITSKIVKVSSGDTPTVNIQLATVPTMLFTVLGPDGRPLADMPVQIKVKQSDGLWGEPQYGPNRTDATGRWRLDDTGGSQFKVRFATESYAAVPGLTSTWYGGGTTEESAAVIDLSNASSRLSATVTLTKPAPATIAPRAVKIAGTARVGRTLSARTSPWSPGPVKLSYTWYRNGKKISGQTKRTYKLRTADRGKRITVRVTGTRPGFTTISRLSGKTAKVAKKR
jgi:hypothetical protein